MSNLQRKLAFSVSKSTANNAEYDSKPAFQASKQSQQTIKKSELLVTKSKTSSTTSKRKRSTATDSKNHSITHFFAPSSPSNLVVSTTVAHDKATTNSPSISDDENITCRIRCIHPVQEIWTSIIHEYSETIDECFRRVRPRIEEQVMNNATDDYPEDMSRQVRCQMTVQESNAFFKQIMDEFIYA